MDSSEEKQDPAPTDTKVILQKLSAMLGSEAWKLLDKHWEIQEAHNMRQALDLKIPLESRQLAVGAYNAIKAMRQYPTQLGHALQSSLLQES